MPSLKSCSAFDRLSSYQWSRIDRERSMKKAFLKFRGLILHVYFLAMLTWIVILRADENQYHVKTALLAIFTGDQYKYVADNVTSWKTFGHVVSRQIFYIYLHSLLLPAFYRGQRRDVPLFGTIRQARVNAESTCDFPQSVIPDVPVTCQPEFNPSTESRAPFGPQNARHWKHSSYHDDIWISGIFATYPPDGYILVLPPTEAAAITTIKDMEENSWIDDATRAVAIDIYVYNHNVNLLCDVELLLEMTEDGVMFPSQTASCARLVEYYSISDSCRLAVDIVVYLMVIYIILKESFFAITFRIERILSLSIIVRVMMIVSTVGATASFILRYNSTTKMLYLWEYVDDDDTDDVLELISYVHYVSVMGERACVYLAAAIFCAWLVLFRYVIFVESTEVVRVIKTSKMDLLQFITFYLIVMLGFALCAYFIFGGNISEFKSFGDSVMALFSIIQGDFDTYELRTEYTYTGLLFFILVAFILYFVCTNMFFVIVNYHYDVVVSTDDGVTDTKYEHFFANVKRNILGKIGIWEKPSGLAVNRESLRKLGFSTSTIQAYESITLGKTQTALMRNLGDGVLQSDLEKVGKKIYEMERKMGQVFDNINAVLDFADRGMFSYVRNLWYSQPSRPCSLLVYPLRLHPDEDVFEKLTEFIESNINLHGAFVLTCVGSVRCVHLRYATGEDGKEKNEFIGENMEICSLVGTCSKEGFHLHGTFGKADGTTISGHILGRMIVQTTAEIVLGDCRGAQFKRCPDPATGFKELKILK